MREVYCTHGEYSRPLNVVCRICAPEAVSYTHLDVTVVMGVKILNRKVLHSVEHFFAQLHEDVYKRQAVVSVLA